MDETVDDKVSPRMVLMYCPKCGMFQQTWMDNARCACCNAPVDAYIKRRANRHEFRIAKFFCEECGNFTLFTDSHADYLEVQCFGCGVPLWSERASVNVFKTVPADRVPPVGVVKRGGRCHHG